MGASAGGRLVTLARIGKAHGLGGEVKIDVLGDRAGALADARWVLVGATQLDARRMEVESLRGAGGRPLLKLAGVSDKDGADALRGLRIFLPRREFPPPAAGEFYQADLVGLRVLAEGDEIGRVAEIVETPAFDVLVVRPDASGAEERLIPFTRAVVKEARPDEGVLLVHAPALRKAEGE